MSRPQLVPVEGTSGPFLGNDYDQARRENNETETGLVAN